MQETQKKEEMYWERAMLQIKSTRALVGASLLTAAGVALKALTINITAALKVSFHFIAIALAGYLYGPVLGGMVGMAADLLGFLLVPTGAYFPGFTLSAFLYGFLSGLWLWRRPVRLWRVIGAVSTCIVGVNLLLNPLWMNIILGGGYVAQMIVRLPTNAVMLPLYTAILYILLRVTETQKRHLVRG